MEDRIVERRLLIWDYMKRRVGQDEMATLVGIHRSTLQKEIKVLKNRVAKPKLQEGDWVKVLPTAMWPSYHGRVGKVFYVTNEGWPAKDQECMVNFEPWDEKAPDSAFQGFMSSSVRKLSDMEVIAELAQ